MEKYIYLSRDQAKKGIVLMYGMESEEIPKYKQYFYDNGLLDAIVYKGKTIPYYVTYIEENDTIREATKEEIIKNNLYVLEETEYFNESGVLMKKPEISRTIAKAEWDEKNYCWIETGTFEEIKEKYLKENIRISDSARTERQTVLSPSLGFRIDCSSIDIENQKIYLNLIKEGLTTEKFKCGDNTFRALTAESIETMIFQASAVILQIYQNKFSIESKINLANSLEELKAIDLEYKYTL